MDTKLKKSNPFGAWLAFFIGIHLMIASVAGGVFIAERTLYSGDALATNYKDTQRFKSSIENNFNSLINSVDVNKEFGWDYSNILYFGSMVDSSGNSKNVQTNDVLKSFNDVENFVQGKSEEFEFIIKWDGSNLSVIQDNNPLKITDEVFYRMQSRYQRGTDYKFRDMRILIAVRKFLPVKHGSIYNSYVEWRILRASVPAVISSFIAGIILLIISSVKRISRKEFTRNLGKISGYFWFETKVLVSALLIGMLTVGDGIIVLFALYTLFWWSYIMLLDLSVNKLRFFTHNSITWLTKNYRSIEDKKPFQKGMLLRFILLVVIELLLLLIVFISMANHNSPFTLILIALGFFIFYRYLKGYTNLVLDLGKIIDQAELIRNGDLNTKLNLPQNSLMYKTAENLNHIQEGFSNAAQEQLKSERMKIELITNVSHDLKTPLTSIVNYIDLLSREELLPEHANDYVKVLNKKAARLTALTQDLFDISKAQSGNLELNIEKIDIVELVKQSIAELEERITESNLNFRINLPQERIYINADGRKLFRVFDNLISNILKYSHPNTRVYIDLLEDNETITLSFKNIASYEMNLDPKELVERFVRGDEARSTDGSGLGLSIVQSFVALNGGDFNIEIDGDLFKAIVKLKKA